MIEFQNATICPRAKAAFSEPPTDVHEAIEFAKAARHIDQAMGILKRGYDLGSLAEHDYDEFLNQIEEAEDILETLGVLEDHDYIRDDLEPRATELFNIDEVDLEDTADEFDNEENWMFGDDLNQSDD